MRGYTTASATALEYAHRQPRFGLRDGRDISTLDTLPLEAPSHLVKSWLVVPLRGR